MQPKQAAASVFCRTRLLKRGETCQRARGRMGACASVAAESGGAVQKQVKTVHKLLLLGAGEAGKSTIFKAIMVTKKGGFSNEQAADFGRLMFRALIKHLQLLMKKDAKVFDRPELEKSRAAVAGVGIDEMPSDLSELMPHVKACATDPAVQELVKQQLEFDESTQYIFTRVETICTPGFQATQDDILKFRNPTTDFSTVDYEKEFVTLRFIDVGGQRKERLKWNQVGKVTAVIFVVALDEYNKTLVEDVTRNRMKESLLLFRMISTKHFQGTPIILFLNKRDLFAEKIKKVDLKCCFNDYTGGCDYDNALAYITDHFRDVAAPNEIYVNVTCATDVGQMEHTFAALEQIVFSMNVNANF